MKITDELIEDPAEPGAYYDVPIYQHQDGTYTATIPGIGRCEVAGKYPTKWMDFALKRGIVP